MAQKKLSRPLVITTKQGDINYLTGKRGKLHRLDGPAVIKKDGTVEYHDEGKRHRVGGPAVILGDGTKIWFQDDVRHRDDGPAIEHVDGSVEWRHRGEVYATVKDFCIASGKSAAETAFYILKWPDSANA